MKVCQLDDTLSEDFTSQRYFGKDHFIKVSREEALIIISSLADQLKNIKGNIGQAENKDVDNKYFSISICEDDSITKADKMKTQKEIFKSRLIKLLESKFHYDHEASSYRKAYEELVKLISEAVNDYNESLGP